MATAAQTVNTQINTFETTVWRLMRWSGVLLIPLAFIHLLFMHIINSVYVIDYHWIIETRWLYLGWRIYDAFLLWFAGLHGFNGLRVVINDYAHAPATNRTLKIVLIGLLVIVFFFGTVALIGSPFQPDPSVPREPQTLILSMIHSL